MSKAKILVTGANGQLGQSIKSIYSSYNNLEFVFTDVEELNITNQNEVIEYTQSKNIDYLINCAAYTAVDKAETEQVKATQLNADAVKNIAIAACKNNFKVIHISTDYVFDGMSFKPYTEDAPTLPESFYGQSKLLGEKYLHDNYDSAITIRTAWLYSEFGNNFAKTMIKLGFERDDLSVVADQIGTPTYAVDLASAILNIITKCEEGTKVFTSGIYHYSNEGVCSWYDFAINIHQLMNIACNVKPISTKEYPTAAPRPYYSVLSKTKLKNDYQITVPYWRSSLEKCINAIKSQSHQ